jgi:hypothetical protein
MIYILRNLLLYMTKKIRVQGEKYIEKKLSRLRLCYIMLGYVRLEMCLFD